MPSKPLIFLAILAALLLVAGAAQANQLVPSARPIALEEEFEFEGEFEAEGAFEAEAEGEEESEEEAEEVEEAECEETREELEEEEEITPAEAKEIKEICKSEEEQQSKAGPGGILPEECLVRTFDSNAIASPSRDRVELTTHYTTFEPTAVTIEYGIGSSRLGMAKRHLGASGVIHLDKHLGGGQIAKLEAAHKLTVQIDVPATPGSCQHYYADSAKVHHG